jgi:glycosyltransferase involved in cell wall biosynthesis
VNPSGEKQKICSFNSNLHSCIERGEGIGLTIADLKEHLRNPQILVIDGNSSDQTVKVAESMGAEVIFQDGLGKGDAIAKAIKCSYLVVDYIVITDADDTYPAEYIPEMIRILEEMPEVGMVCGNRSTATWIQML